MLSLPQAQLDEYADKLILNSAQSSFTRLYECVPPVAAFLPDRPRTGADSRARAGSGDAVSSRGTRTGSCERDLVRLDAGARRSGSESRALSDGSRALHHRFLCTQLRVHRPVKSSCVSEACRAVHTEEGSESGLRGLESTREKAGALLLLDLSTTSSQEHHAVLPLVAAHAARPVARAPLCRSRPGPLVLLLILPPPGSRPSPTRLVVPPFDPQPPPAQAPALCRRLGGGRRACRRTGGDPGQEGRLRRGGRG